MIGGHQLCYEITPRINAGARRNNLIYKDITFRASTMDTWGEVVAAVSLTCLQICYVQGRCYCGSRNPQRSCPGRIGGGRVARSRLCDGGRESASSAVWRHSAWVDCSSDRRSWLVLAIWREGAEPAEANLVGLTRKNSFVRTASYGTKSW
jgi:hypothetical protein